MNKKLYTARKQRHWSQEAAAERCEVSRTTYIRWEQDGQYPRGYNLTKACEAFNMTPEDVGFIDASIEEPIVQRIPKLVEVEATTLVLAQQPLAPFGELYEGIEQTLRRIDTMSKQQGQDNVSRRETIKLLMTIPAATFGLTQADKLPMLQEDEIVSLCSVNVPLAWRLYFAGGLGDVKQLLPTYIAQLSNIALKPTRYGKQAAALASQAHQLGYLVALQNQDYGTALTQAQYAFYHAEIAGDTNLQVASLIRQGNLYHTLKRPIQTLQKYQTALQHSDNSSPLLKGQVYIGLAEAYAGSHQEQQALRYKGLAKDTFPEMPEDDIHFAYTHFNHFTLTNFEGLMYLHLDQPRQAWASFDEISKAIPTTLIPQRVELLSRQATTAVALNDMGQSCTLVELVATAALKLGSNLRYNEASETYENMRTLWPNEAKVKALDELFQA